tara:strand:+ start:851 stop:1123 length:273 start_codon:yes stop_codon:yes gene_type:complete
MRKQKLSPKASKAKAIRDHKIAMTPARKKKRVDNQRVRRAKLTEMVAKLGSLSKAKSWLAKRDFDHKDGRFELIKKNRGNDGNGTKSEKK